MLWTTIRKARNHCLDVDHCRDEDHCQYHLGINQCQDGNRCQDGNEHADDQDRNNGALFVGTKSNEVNRKTKGLWT